MKERLNHHLTSLTRLLGMITALMLVPAYAYANAGTALMWLGFFHVAIGNFFIGMFESWLLVKFFNHEIKRATSWMIGANYFSALAGVFLLSTLKSVLPISVDNAWLFFWLLAAVFFLGTVALEWPFVYMSEVKGSRSSKKSLKASFVVQGVSYVLMFLCYWQVSATSLYTDARRVDLTEFNFSEPMSVFFIGEDGDIYRKWLGEGSPEKVLELNSENENDRLVLTPNKGKGTWDLVASISESGVRDIKIRELVKDFASGAALANRDRHALENDKQYYGAWANFGMLPKLDETAESSWEFSTSVWAAGGVSARSELVGVRRRWFAFETPFGELYMRNGTHLPGDIALFQAGRSDIYLVDPAESRLAFVAKGRSPIVVLEKHLLLR